MSFDVGDVVLGERVTASLEFGFDVPHIKTVWRCGSYEFGGGECSILGVTGIMLALLVLILFELLLLLVEFVPFVVFRVGGSESLFTFVLTAIEETLFAGEGPPDEHDTFSINGGDAFGVFTDCII